jgi:acyl carrier protein
MTSMNDVQISTASLRDVIVAAYRETLRDESLGPDSDFYEAGGDSISAFRIIARVRDAFGLDVPVATVFTCPTPGDLADAVAAARG